MIRLIGIDSDNQSEVVLKIAQPFLLGWLDGSLSTLAPIFAAAFLSGSRAALLVGLATSCGAGISMGLSEGLSDDGLLSSRGNPLIRGAITGLATFVGGALHSLPFLNPDVHQALILAYIVIAIELSIIAIVRKIFLKSSLRSSLVQVVLGGLVIIGVGIFFGSA